MKNTSSIKKATAAITAAALIIACAPFSYAAAPMPKDETVYVNMDEAGSVRNIYVVNSFELTAPGTIADYGAYEKVTNLTDGAPAEQKGDMVTLNAPAGKISYEGQLKSKETPWNISIKYFLNGKEITPQNLGGQSGALRIVIKIRQNNSVNKTFFEHYALQLGVTLNADRCKNIVSKDATIASAGGNKQLAFIVFPGTAPTLEVTADVTDFEMPGISANGVCMNMSFDVDSMLSGDSGLGGLGSAFGDLNNGTQSLLRGVKQLNSGINGLSGGASELSSGLGSLSANSASLVAGARQLVDGMFAQVSQQFSDGLVKQGMPPLATPLTLENYASVLAGMSGVTDAMRAAAKAGLQASLPPGTPLTGTAFVLANSLFAAGSKPSAAFAAAMAKLGVAGKVQVAQGKLAALSPGDSPLAISEVGRVISTLASAAGVPGNIYYDNLVSQLKTATPSLDDATCALMITIACLEVDGKDISLFNTALANTGQMLQVAGEVAAAQKNPSAGNEETAFLTALVMENLGGQFSQLKAQLDGIASFYNGLVQYTGGVNQVSDGASKLSGGLKEYKKGVSQLYSGVKQLNDGTSQFSELENSSDLVGDLMGGDFDPISFVSPRNTTVNSVQFVMQTAAVVKPDEAADAITETKPATFWERIKNLF
ncbi:MAG: hypothetical protein RRZ42_03615 [Oscillospiraceae bacterium]